VIIAGAAVLSTVQAGSLWRDGVTDERGMFADKRAKRVGDIVTIVVNESAALTNSQNLTTAKQSTSDAANVVGNVVNQFITALPATLLGKKLQAAANNGTVIAPTPAPLAVSGTTQYTGGGQIQNSQTVTTRAAVEVIDVLPNGNLVIEGLRQVSFSNEKQYASLHGIIRPYDIQSDNTVQSTNIADARIEIVSQGSLTDAQKKGWLMRLNEKVNPF
jgi:flagellar L-ring protein precursor FlgH